MLCEVLVSISSKESKIPRSWMITVRNGNTQRHRNDRRIFIVMGCNVDYLSSTTCFAGVIEAVVGLVDASSADLRVF